MATYSQKFGDRLNINGVNILQTHPGKVFWVGNSPVLLVNEKTASDGNNGSYLAPFSTIDYAIGQCSAGNHDIIAIKPGHTTTVSAAAGIALDVAGVQIIGLGVGAARPTITLNTATTASIKVTAANCSINNVIISANFADIVTVFDVVAAKNFKIRGCYFKETAVDMNFKNIVDTGTVANDADGLEISDCVWIEPDTATLSLIKCDNTIDDVVVERNYLNLGVNNNVAAGITVATGKVITNLRMEANRVIRLNTDTATGALLFATDGSTNSGIVCANFSQHADTAAELIVTASSGLSLFDNKSSGVNGNSGYIIATIDS